MVGFVLGWGWFVVGADGGGTGEGLDRYAE